MMSLNRRTFVSSATLGTVALTSCVASTGAAQNANAVGQSTLPGRTFTKSYFIPSPLDVTWRAFTDPAQRHVWFMPDRRAEAAQGNQSGSAQSEKAAPKSPPYVTRGVIDHPGLPGPTENMASFEAVEGGTRITHTLGGYGDSPVWENALQSSADGVDEMMSDLALYLRTGVGFPRHTGAAFPQRTPHPNDLRFGTRQAPGGVEVFDVPAGTLAAEVGLQPGDIVVALGDAGIFCMRDLRLANRMHAPGDVVEVTWVRGKQILKGRGRMTVTKHRWRNGFDPRSLHDQRGRESGN